MNHDLFEKIRIGGDELFSLYITNGKGITNAFKEQLNKDLNPKEIMIILQNSKYLIKTISPTPGEVISMNTFVELIMLDLYLEQALLLYNEKQKKRSIKYMCKLVRDLEKAELINQSFPDTNI